ncbi:unnamed protein product [Taenia asiatica]|uniref:START domain-containing protein n=1 Tax=Taenia asiatica TaxID=60517 RepID=A0A0R3VTL9_TAEAS|nr:unnamed protein product [Taenia asiatica]
MSVPATSQIHRLNDALVSAASSDALCMLIQSVDENVNHLTSLMVSKREFLEETKLRRDVEKKKLDVSHWEVDTITNIQQSSSPEEKVNTLIERWTNSRLGGLSLLDNAHVVLDTSTSSILKDNPTQSPESGGRIRCLLRQPRDCEAAFGVDNLHPLGGSMKAMEIAQAATQAMTPSVAVNYTVWKQLSETIK